MPIVKWTNKQAAKLRWRDIQAIKISTVAFTLMVAKLWPEVLGLEWHWYLIISLVFAFFPVRKVLSK